MFTKTMKQFLFGSALVVSSLFADMTVNQRIEDFESFWASYKSAYVFFELKNEDYGLNWDDAKEGFIERLENSNSDLELYKIVTEAQALLRDGHCYNGAFSKVRETERIYFQRIGLGLVEGKKIAVTKVVKGSVFEKAGIKVGYELIKFDGKTIRQKAKQMRKLISASSEGQFWSIFAGQIYIHSPLLGKPASPKAEMVFRDLDGNIVSVDSKWNSAEPTGKQEASSSWIDDKKGVKLTEAIEKKISGPLPISVRIFKDANVGYVKIDSWMKTEDPIEQFEEVFKAIKNTDGLILDLRNNGGGVGPWGILFTNYLIDKASDHDKKSFFNLGDRVKGWLSKLSGKDYKDEKETSSPEFTKTPNDTWFERKLSKTFFRASFSQLSEKDLESIYTDPATMKYVLTKAFKLDISDEEIMKHYKDGRFEEFYVNLPLNDRLNKIAPYTKPVYALTNGGCFSTTDICLTILHEFDRLKIVGTPNGAGSGSPIPFVLPNSGLQVYVPHARAFPPYGTMIEGRPLPVDYRVTQSKEDLVAGKDTVLTEAMKLILSEINPSSSTFASEEVSATDGETLYNTIKDKKVDWGNISMPDWAIQATLEQIKRDSINFKK